MSGSEQWKSYLNGQSAGYNFSYRNHNSENSIQQSPAINGQQPIQSTNTLITTKKNRKNIHQLGGKRKYTKKNKLYRKSYKNRK
jgi:hypothetical protein